MAPRMKLAAIVLGSGGPERMAFTFSIKFCKTLATEPAMSLPGKRTVAASMKGCTFFNTVAIGSLSIIFRGARTSVTTVRFWAACGSTDLAKGRACWGALLAVLGSPRRPPQRVTRLQVGRDPLKIQRVDYVGARDNWCSVDRIRIRRRNHLWPRQARLQIVPHITRRKLLRRLEELTVSPVPGTLCARVPAGMSPSKSLLTVKAK